MPVLAATPPEILAQYELVIGLEVHCQLATRTKIFCSCPVEVGNAPNTNVCPVCLGLPGALPVLSRQAVELAIRGALALHCDVQGESIFARKNYFYPDLPKGYQISQYERPVVEDGTLEIVLEDGTRKTIGITRAHLEEDAGKSLHEDFHGLSGIDLNRAGTPLLEIVSEPDMRSAEEAVAYAKALHTLVRWIDVCDGNMQEGSFRCDANVSVRPAGSTTLGTRREIKNLNSFRFLQQAIEYEVRWQINELEDGRAIQQATVLFDPDSGETRMMRTKEDAHDYRYFPDPDLLPLEVTAERLEAVRAAMPPLPQARREKFCTQYGLTPYDAGLLTASRELADYFESVVSGADAKTGKLCANWISGALSARLNEEGLEIAQSRLSAQQLRGLVDRIADGTISGKIAKDIFDAIWAGEGDADAIIAAKGLKQISDSGEIEKIVDQVLAANAQQVADFRAGKEKAFNSLVGQVMKASRGKANPQQVNDILRRKLAP